MSPVLRVYTKKEDGLDVESKRLLSDLKNNFLIENIKSVKILNRYDIEGLAKEHYELAEKTIISEPPLDIVYKENIDIDSDERMFSVCYLPGQYDQRADSLIQCFQIITGEDNINAHVSKVYIIKGNITDYDFETIKNYCINPVDSMLAPLEKPDTINMPLSVPEDVKTIEGFISMTDDQIKKMRTIESYAMSEDDLIFCRDYFRDTEKRNPTITEIKVIDTYWSDHCRHTTFLTEIKNISIEDGYYSEPIKKSFDDYMSVRKALYIDRDKPICLMDLATIGAKSLKSQGYLNDIDESDEVNACSIEIDVEIIENSGIEKTEKWLLMFKNETHNHPTEIEPFGGAATCLGGAIRDPLSGRSYVYQAMRVTGSGDPRVNVAKTIQGKLPQIKITTEAANGYSSYGNQIGIATGIVKEIYNENFIAKRLEIGAVIGAAKKDNVKRETPLLGDVVILVGGRTGRDGCGGATGSSKQHTDISITESGAEVQKGNAPTERKLQRLFRNPKASKLIKRCNDFGAGGVCVAVGELTDSLSINLDSVPKKYEGLDGTEIAISESQERMAVVVSDEDSQKFIEFAYNENLEATVIARVTDDGRLKMSWKDKVIVDLERRFLNTNGVTQKTDVLIKSPYKANLFEYLSNLLISDNSEKSRDSLKERFLQLLSNINICSQKGLVEKFDSTIGAATVLMPFGGKSQLTPEDVMAAKLPVLDGDCKTASMMSYGYDPDIFIFSPYHGGVFSVLQSVSNIVASGGKHKKIRLSFQEYFEKMTDDSSKWGKPASALLGALNVQLSLKIPAIGGKDSMSGTFNDMHVPPTLVSFAVATENINNIISSEFKNPGNTVILYKIEYNEYDLPVYEKLIHGYELIEKLIEENVIVSACALKKGGVAEAVCKMAFGNGYGFSFNDKMDMDTLFNPYYGSIVFELDSSKTTVEELYLTIKNETVLNENNFIVIGEINNSEKIKIYNTEISLDALIEKWVSPLEKTFPTMEKLNSNNYENAHQYNIFDNYNNSVFKDKIQHKINSEGNINTNVTAVGNTIKTAKPKIFIPIFPGTNCEYDTARAFEKAGGEIVSSVFKNISKKDIDDSIDEIVRNINKCQIISFAGGFSAGDEPDGSGKFIAAIFRNSRIKEATENLLYKRDGLILGICNGFQVLIKLGLLTEGIIGIQTPDSPTLTYNSIGRHVSQICSTKIVSNMSPFLWNTKPGEIYNIPISHGEGRFLANNETLLKLSKNNQIAIQYVDSSGNAAVDTPHNPNGSSMAIEAMSSPDGRILGKMGHSERIGDKLYINVSGEYNQKIFKAGIEYYS